MHADVSILKEKAARFNSDREIQALLAELANSSSGTPEVGKFPKAQSKKLLTHAFDRASMAAKKLPYERLDQLTIEVLLGAR